MKLLLTFVISKRHLNQSGWRGGFSQRLNQKGEAMDLQHYLSRLKPGMCSGRLHVLTAFRYNRRNPSQRKKKHYNEPDVIYWPPVLETD